MRRRQVLLGALGASAVATAGAAAVISSAHGRETEDRSRLFAHIADASKRTFSPAELRADLDDLCEALIDICVAPFARTSRMDFEAHRARVAAGLNRSLDTFGFGLRVAPLFAGLQDGHIAIDLNDMMWQYARDGGRVFPLQLEFTPNGTFVTQSAALGVPEGSRLLAVDGREAADLTATILACTSAPTLPARRQFASNVGSTMAWMRAMLGARDAFDVRYESGGRILRSRVQALTQKEAVRRLTAGPIAPATFRTLAAGSVGYLEYRRCEPGDALDRALHDAFSRAKAAGVRALVVDVRRNRGGSDSANDQVLNYLTSKPYVQGTRFSVRSSRRLKDKYGFFGYVQRYFAPSAWFAPEGSVITIDVAEIFARTTPGGNALRFDGPIDVLVGPGTFSSAMSFRSDGPRLRHRDARRRTAGRNARFERAGRHGAGAADVSGCGHWLEVFLSDETSAAVCRLAPDLLVATRAADTHAGRDPVLATALTRARRH